MTRIKICYKTEAAQQAPHRGGILNGIFKVDVLWEISVTPSVFM